MTIFRSALLVVIVALFAFSGCKDRNQGNKLTKEKAKKIMRWAAPHCDRVYKQVSTLCADFYKKKKRKMQTRKEMMRTCLKNTASHPRQMLGRLRCMSEAPTCAILRHCQRCGAAFCPKWKKGPKVPKADLDKMQKKIMEKMKKAAARRGKLVFSGARKAPTKGAKKAPAKDGTKAPARAPAKDTKKAPAKDAAKAPARAPAKAPAKAPKPRTR